MKMHRSNFITPVKMLVIFVLSLATNVTPAKILSVAFISYKSHKIVYEPLLDELAGRGHEVTILSPIPAANEVKNVREILTLDVERIEVDTVVGKPSEFDMKEKGTRTNAFRMVDKFGKFCELTYDLPQVKALFNEQFDLVIMLAIFNECTAGYVYKFNTSIILISPVSVPSWVVRYTGGSSLPSFVPSTFSPYDDQMTFYERVVNFSTEMGITLIQSYYFTTAMEAIYRNKLQDQNIPSVFKILQNTSLVLSNGHFSIGSPKPFLPDIVEVAGMHCRPSEKLPVDLEVFAQGSGEDGFIYFSMGTHIRGASLPEEKRKLFLAAFSKMKQRVLWKWETETMPDLPPNVKLSKWLPQQDILGHPKLRVFITHGGFGSTTEAVYHGVPIIGIPMFGDQELNMQFAKNRGFAILLNYLILTEEKLLQALQKVVNDPSFTENAKALSEIFRDQPQAALDRAVFWTEYVIRHGGAVHLRSAARDLNFVQYYSIDVISLLLLTTLTSLYIVFKFIRFVVLKLYFIFYVF